MLRRWIGLVAVSLFAQDGPPVRILRGELTDWKIRGLAGELTVRGVGSHLSRCRVHPDTYLTRETIRINPTGVRVGDSVDIVADFREGAERCLALTIYVRAPEARRAGGRWTFGLPTPANFLDNLLPRGNLTFAGRVSQIEGNRLVLRTRRHGEQAFTLRDDTIFSDWGRSVPRSDLTPQTEVYVRAGHGFDGGLEAYQIVWGRILSPTPWR